MNYPHCTNVNVVFSVEHRADEEGSTEGSGKGVDGRSSQGKQRIESQAGNKGIERRGV